MFSSMEFQLVGLSLSMLIAGRFYQPRICPRFLSLTRGLEAYKGGGERIFGYLEIPSNCCLCFPAGCQSPRVTMANLRLFKSGTNPDERIRHRERGGVLCAASIHGPFPAGPFVVQTYVFIASGSCSSECYPPSLQKTRQELMAHAIVLAICGPMICTSLGIDKSRV